MLSLEDAYDAALSSGVWVERPAGLRLVRLTGPQRVWFLQNTITADVEGVPAGRWVESCFLDAKGRVQAHLRVGVRPEDLWLDASPDAERLAHWLQTYRFRTKVEIEVRPSRCFSVYGPPAAAVAADGEFPTEGAPAFGYVLGEVSAADVHAERPLETWGEQAPAELSEILRVEAGVGAYGADFGERDLPQEAGLTRTLSVDKGCYVGQETVARIHFRGHINRTLRPLRFPSDEPAVGADLRWEGGIVGRVTSVARSPRAGLVGIGMVRVEPPEGAELAVEGGGTATVGPLPEGTKVKTG